MTGPTRRDRLRPLELVGLAALLGAFTAVVAFAGTRDGRLALIFAGIAFIVGLLVLAMLALAAGTPDEQDDGPEGETVLDRNDRRRDRKRRRRRKS